MNFLKHLNISAPSFLIIGLFLFVFILFSLQNMLSSSFHEFDEAHRAENAKRMREYKEYLIPLTGSGFDRFINFSIPFNENPDLRLYYHLERPFLVYFLMILSTQIFGDIEFAYRLPSFIFGLGTIFVLIFFAKKFNQKFSFLGLGIGLLCFITSIDLWLSSQYAQLDTSITFFLFLSLLSLLYYANSKIKKYLVISGLSFAGAILTKGQPAIIFILPFLFLLLIRKINFRDSLIFTTVASVLLVPWLSYLSLRFGVLDFVKIFTGFAISSSDSLYLHHEAPLFWYLRWFWETFRPGWTIFLALFFYDLYKRNFNYQKIVLLVYVFGGLFFFSILVNKIWWYVLPLVPAISFYIYLSASAYLKIVNSGRIRLSILILLASLPVFLEVRNTLSLLYGLLTTITGIILLTINLKFEFHQRIINLIFIFSLLFSLIIFSFRFPKIVPYHPSIKPLSLQYNYIDEKKCLWVYNVPSESALYYSEAGEVGELNESTPSTQIFKNCQNNYLLTPLKIEDQQFKDFPNRILVKEEQGLSLIKL